MLRHVSPAAFVGRVQEFDQLRGALSSARGGGVVTALVSGEAGIGKSRLVLELVELARRTGSEVLVARCPDLESGGAPLGPVIDAIRGLGHRLDADKRPAVLGTARLLVEPTGPPDASGASPTWVFDVVRDLLERLGAGGPPVVVLDDIHWADSLTRDLLRYLSGTPLATGLLIAATFRDDRDRAGLINRLVTELDRRGALHLRLQPFELAEVVAHMTSLLGRPPDSALLAAIAARSDGNPFFIEELLAAFGEGPDLPLPPALRDAMDLRLARLSPRARSLVRAAAVAGRSVDHDLLSQVADLDDTDLFEALRECIDQQVLMSEDGGYAFRHALLHETARETLLPAEAKRLHERCARAIEAQPDRGGWLPAMELARHWAAAGESGAALRWAIEAAEAARTRYAIVEAYEIFEWALELWDAAGPEARSLLATGGGHHLDHVELLAEAAAAAHQAADYARALQLTEAALAELEAEAEADRAGLLQERRAWYLMRAGRTDEGLAAYEVAGELVERAGPAARARVEAGWARALARVGRLVDAARLAASAHDAALASGDIVCEGQAHHVLGLIAAAEGEPNRAREELLEAARIGADAGDMAAVAGPLVHLWRTLVEDGRGGAMADLLLSLIASDVASGTGRQLLAAIAAAVLDQLGRLDEALELISKDAGRAASGLPGVIDAVVRGAIEVDRGDHVAARARLEAARPLARRTGDGRLNGLLYRALVELATWEGRLDDTGPLVEEGMAVLAHTGETELAARLSASGLRALADRAERDRRAGRRVAKSLIAEAEALHDQLLALEDETAWRSPPPVTEVGASLRTGSAELARLRGEAAPDEWRGAVEAWDVLGIPYAAAMCRYRLAEAELLAGGDDATDAAKHALDTAATTAARLGTRPLLGAIEQLARRARLSVDRLDARSERGSAAPHHVSAVSAAPVGNVELTPREREVLALLEQGATNGEIARTLFISEKTASVHVSHILAKLGVSNRREAAALASRLGTSGP